MIGNENPPKRPTRAAKHVPRESSGLLMSVIRTLSASESNEQRDREKAQLQREFNRSNNELDKHISRQDDSIKNVLQIFSETSVRLAESREKIQNIRQNLVACKKLLHCKKDELKDRWLEGVEHKHVMALLQQIDDVREVSEKINHVISSKDYLKASQMLSTALSNLQNNLQGIEALKQVQQELTIAKESLGSELIENLHTKIYHTASEKGDLLKRHGSANTSGGYGRFEQGRKMVSKPLNNFVNYLDEEEPMEAADSDAGEVLGKYVECLALLGKMPQAVETIKERMQKEFTMVIQRVNRRVVSQSHTLHTEASDSKEGDSAIPSMATARNGFIKISQRDSKLMQELIQSCWSDLKQAVTNHQLVLEKMRSSCYKHQISLQLYSMTDVWARVQGGLQVLVSQYVDLAQPGLKGPASVQMTSQDHSTEMGDLSSFFGKKGKNRPKNQDLFKFEASFHAMTLNSYLLEQLGQQPSMDETLEKKTLDLMVCESSPHNITVFYNPLMLFVEEIEESLGYKPGEKCSLNEFLSDLLKDVFLARLHMDTARRQEQATKALDLWTTTGHSSYKVSSAGAGTGASKPDLPLLQSSVLVWECLEELSQLMVSIPSSAQHFVSMMCSCLLNYRETCQAAYKAITQPESEDKRIISATWAKDEDISRFLKELPNWKTLATTGGAVNDVIDSPDEVSERNRKEAEILLGSLGEQLIPRHEILSDHLHLRTLALLHQTLEWFGGCIVKLSISLSTNYDAEEGGRVPQAAIQTIASLAQDYLELSHTCLLVLHLEVRVHCFYYLLSVGRGSPGSSGSNFAPTIDSQDPDDEVLALNRDLANIDETLSATLPTRKCKYIFEGLGPLISNIVTSWPTHIRRLNENGIKRMCRNILSLQQQLTNITMTRELSLDRARQYYEMLYLTPQEVLNQLMSGGVQFTELEYLNAIQLLHRSDPESSKAALEQHLQRLSEILGDVGVTV